MFMPISASPHGMGSKGGSIFSSAGGGSGPHGASSCSPIPTPRFVTKPMTDVIRPELVRPAAATGGGGGASPPRSAASGPFGKMVGPPSGAGQGGFTAPRAGPFEPLTAPLNAPAVGTDPSGNHSAVFYVVPPKALTEALTTTTERGDDGKPPAVILKTSSVLSGYKADDPLSNVAVEKKASFIFGQIQPTPQSQTVTDIHG